MAEESTLQFLYRRRRELIAQIAALRGQLAPKERELEQVDKMLTTVGAPLDASVELLPQRNSNATVTDYVSALQPFLQPIAPETSSALAAAKKTMDDTLGVSPETLAALKEAVEGYTRRTEFNPKYANMTIKELVIQALIDHFPKGGTMMEIRDFIRLGYGRTIEPSSMRPQMHRLKADNILTQDASNDTWNLVPEKRREYSMYDHPSTRRAMKELQDDDPLDPTKTIAGAAAQQTKGRGKLI